MYALEGLPRCPDVATLKLALYGLCERFGHIARLDILTAIHEGTRQAICFLKMESPEKDQLLMNSLGVGRFGGEIVIVVDLTYGPGGEAQEPSSQWAQI